MSIMDKDLEDNLLEEWYGEMQKPLPNYFMEPVLNQTIMITIRRACDIFKQTYQVFFSSVDVAEKYLISKKQRGEEMEEPLLSVITIVFTVSKFYGGEPTLNIETVRTYLCKITLKNVIPKAIKQAERDILQDLKFKISPFTVLDDLNVLFEKIIRKYCMRDRCRKLCVLILIQLYMTKPKWLQHLKCLYQREMRSLKHLLCNRSYLPAVVIISAFKLTWVKNVYDINGMLESMETFTKIHPDSMETFTKIHPDHIHALSDFIVEEHSKRV